MDYYIVSVVSGYIPHHNGIVLPFGRAFGSVYSLIYEASALCANRAFVIPYNLGAHLLALFALFVFTLPDVLTFHTLFALLRLAERRKQFCAQTAYSPNSSFLFFFSDTSHLFIASIAVFTTLFQ